MSLCTLVYIRWVLENGKEPGSVTEAGASSSILTQVQAAGLNTQGDFTLSFAEKTSVPKGITVTATPTDASGLDKTKTASKDWILP
jgi:hypothetical protein